MGVPAGLGKQNPNWNPAAVNLTGTACCGPACQVVWGSQSSRLPDSAISFHSNALSVNATSTNPTVDAAAIVANLKPITLPGLDVLISIHFA